LSFLDPETLDTLYTVAGIVGSAVVVTVFIMRRLYERQRNQEPLDDIARELADYIRCIEQMRQEYLGRFAESISEQDRDFFRRLIAELDDNLDRYQRQLLGIIEQITRGR
jgi:hypothetical protein